MCFVPGLLILGFGDVELLSAFSCSFVILLTVFSDMPAINPIKYTYLIVLKVFHIYITNEGNAPKMLRITIGGGDRLPTGGPSLVCDLFHIKKGDNQKLINIKIK